MIEVAQPQLKVTEASDELLPSPHADTRPVQQTQLGSHSLRGLRWSWACRQLLQFDGDHVSSDQRVPPRAGDVVVVEVAKVGNHTRMTLSDHRRARLYAGDHLVGVLGNRYATDAFEGQIHSLEELHVLTGAGMIGTVQSRHRDVASPTSLRFLGYLTREDGERINLKEEQFHPQRLEEVNRDVLLVVGTGMNSGKTTTVVRLVKGLVEDGVRVSACKLTGSVSERDRMEMLATDAHDVRDFSDYGFPSTYLTEEQELVDLYETMVHDSSVADPDIIVMEIADGILQRETSMLLSSPEIARRVRGVVLAAGCATSALFGIHEVNRLGHKVTAVSGKITSSPLFVRELANSSDVPIGCSAKQGQGLARIVTQKLGLRA